MKNTLTENEISDSLIAVDDAIEEIKAINELEAVDIAYAKYKNVIDIKVVK